MRVVVDTSVWSLALRRRSSVNMPEVQVLKDLIIEGRAIMLGAVRQEVLSGIRHKEQFEKLKEVLEAFPDEEVHTEDYVEAASLCNRCLDSGVTTGNTDCLIAAVSIARGLEVLSTDKDFQHMSKAVPIRLHKISS